MQGHWASKFWLSQGFRLSVAPRGSGCRRGSCTLGFSVRGLGIWVRGVRVGNMNWLRLRV